jgi:hypothetical protein
MDPLCQPFRTRWLEHLLDAGERTGRDRHLDACAACQAWIGGAHAQVTAFARLPRRPAPAELERRLFPLQAAALAATEERARRLSELERQDAPAILDRLVEEELASPEAARARRFAGDLARHATPATLEQRVFPVRGPAARVSRRHLSLALCATAALAVLGLSLFFERDGGSRERPFIVHRGRPARSHAMVAELAQGWAPDFLPAAPGTPPEQGR